jgi:hypothetical protein
MKKLSFLLISAVLLSGLALAQSTDRQDNHDRPQAERITHGPVVESVGSSWATVAWSTDTGGSSVVRYGTERDRLTQMAESRYAVSKSDQGITHRVKIDHLRPGTTYYFMVDSGQGEGTGTEARSGIEEFTTKR